MSSCSWSAAPLPIRTGREPRQPSKWSRVSSVRSDVPSTRYMIFSGRRAVAPAAAVLDQPVADPLAEGGGLADVAEAEQRVDRERGVPDPGVAVVPVPLAAGRARAARWWARRPARRSARRSSASASWPSGRRSPATGRGRSTGAPSHARTGRCHRSAAPVRPARCGVAGRPSTPGPPRRVSPSCRVTVSRRSSPIRSTVELAVLSGRYVALAGRVQGQVHVARS